MKTEDNGHLASGVELGCIWKRFHWDEGWVFRKKRLQHWYPGCVWMHSHVVEGHGDP